MTGKTLNIAVQGCCHGELDAIYSSIKSAEQRTGEAVDLLVVCGDFQCARIEEELTSMAVPPKHRKLTNFCEYLMGLRVAPVPTIFVGGNHEASNVLQALPYGGYVAPRIYYLGNSGVVNFKGLRIGGVSGIYNHHHYHQAHFESPPYSPNTLRSVYHYRSIDVDRLAMLAPPFPPPDCPTRKIDIFLSHDWPRGIYHYGDTLRLKTVKPFLSGEIDTNTLGSEPLHNLLHHLRPKLWFAAHLHTYFPAIVAHANDEPTRFLALDKVINGRNFLQFLKVPIPEGTRVYEDDELHFDVQFCSILRSTHYLNRDHLSMAELVATQAMSEENLQRTTDLLTKEYGAELCIPSMFPVTSREAFNAYVNAQGDPQTMRLLDALQLSALAPWQPVMHPSLRAILAPYFNASYNLADAEGREAVTQVTERQGDAEDVDSNALDI